MLNKIESNLYQGTVKDFVESGLKINGKAVDAVTLSGMGRYQLLKQVGEQKPQRGRAAAVYEISTENTHFSF